MSINKCRVCTRDTMLVICRRCSYQGWFCNNSILPINEDKKVEVMFRAGCKGIGYVNTFCWAINNKIEDIVAYRYKKQINTILNPEDLPI